MKYNIILHITTACNYNCSYCDVVKDGKKLSHHIREWVVAFGERNTEHIDTFKFFWWEPLLAYKDIEYLCDELPFLGRYQIVTNTTLLNPSIWEYFHKFFKIIFLSIDTEHDFEYEKVHTFLMHFDLREKAYFNLIISPGSERASLDQFMRLYDYGYRGFNILPVYFTKPWSPVNLGELATIMKDILDLAHKDATLKLYGFQENKWYDTSLVNHSLFIDIDGEVYYSDMVSTFSGRVLKESLHLWNIATLHLGNIDDTIIEKHKKIISDLEKSLYSKTPWQRQLHKMMDYFSLYLNRTNEQSV